MEHTQHMPGAPPLVKIACEDWEFAEIHRLNHQTFAEEIPQHPRGPTDSLIDRFHRENTYVVAVEHRTITAMVAVRSRRPFSLDGKLPDLDRHLPPNRHVCELRLLAVTPSRRSTSLLAALLAETWRHVVEAGYDLAIISAYVRQLKLYRHLGFEPFGPIVGTPPDVLFQPMMLTLERFAPAAPELFGRRSHAHAAGGRYLPGPVAVHADVRAAFNGEPLSHRSDTFLARVDIVAASLRTLVRARRVAILLGSGTLANDVVAARLALLGEPGLVLTNGEFGDRLVDHARRAGLSFDVVAHAWGQPFDLDDVAARLVASPTPGWLWFVHCETSTGVLNDLEAIDRLRAARGVRMCVDAISSIGTTPVDLGGAYLASGVSGKGIGGYPGLAFVFHDHDVAPAPHALPRVFDLGLYASERGVPFTQSSNLACALDAALERLDVTRRTATLAELAAWLRARLTLLGFDLVGRDAMPAPGVVTIALPEDVSSLGVAAALERAGCEIGARSRYLADRNWIQIALMGADISLAALSTLSILLFATCERMRRAPHAAVDRVGRA